MKYRNKILIRKVVLFCVAVLLVLFLLFRYDYISTTPHKFGDSEIGKTNQPIIEKLDIKHKHAVVGGLLEEVMWQEIDGFFGANLVGATAYDFPGTVNCIEFDVYVVYLEDDATEYYMVPVGPEGEHLRYIYLYHYFNNSLELIWTDQTE